MQFSKTKEPTYSVDDKILKIFENKLPFLKEKNVEDWSISWDHSQFKFYNLHLNVTNTDSDSKSYYIFTVDFQNGLKNAKDMVDWRFQNKFDFDGLNTQLKEDFGICEKLEQNPNKLQNQGGQ